mmetsp:Transcript_39858/g.86891  ORF Transcript_39858/g.86891 Transcript_39858/m.86891 type:complete len:80 (+) Transcript_39858:106-345(+)
MAGGCATFCVIMSAIGVPLMAFFGILCLHNSPMIDIPDANKQDAGKGCLMASAMYAVTLVYAYFKMNSAKAQAREVKRA